MGKVVGDSISFPYGLISNVVVVNDFLLIKGKD